MQRLLFALSFVVLGLRGQFTGLATPADGSRVYFASPLRLKGTGQPAHGKLFVADTTGVRLVRSRERVEPEPFNPIGGWGLTNAHSYRSAEVSSDGRVVAADLLRVCLGGCRAAINRQASSVLGATPAQDADREGSLQLSRNGRYALRSFGFYPLSTGLSVIDLQTGAERRIPPLNERLAPPPGRAIADDGSVLLASEDRIALVRPDNSIVEHAPGALEFLALAHLAAAADTAVYTVRSGGWDGFVVRHIDLRNGRRQTLVELADSDQVNVSDDGRLVLYLAGNPRKQAMLLEPGRGTRQLTAEPRGVQTAILSGDGRVVYAVTGGGRLVRIDAASGAETEIIGPTTDLTEWTVQGWPGDLVTLSGVNLQDEARENAPPLPPFAGDLTMWLGGRKVPVLRVTPESVTFQIPWDTAYTSSDFPAPATAERTAPSLFEPPIGSVWVRPPNATFAGGVIGSFANPKAAARTGDIVHFFMVGLGPTSPPAVTGDVAPRTEPLARLSPPIQCSPEVEVLYAGLAPGFYSLYQVDVRILAPYAGRPALDVNCAGAWTKVAVEP